jgi:hypothetical protein
MKKIKLSNIQKSFSHIFGGNVLLEDLFRRNIPFIIAIVVLMMTFTGYRFGVLQKMAETDRLRRELRDARYESLAISAELTRAGRKAEIERRVEEAGLDIGVSQEPVFYIQRRTRRR